MSNNVSSRLSEECDCVFKVSTADKKGLLRIAISILLIDQRLHFAMQALVDQRVVFLLTGTKRGWAGNEVLETTKRLYQTVW